MEISTIAMMSVAGAGLLVEKAWAWKKGIPGRMAPAKTTPGEAREQGAKFLIAPSLQSNRSSETPKL